MSTRQRYEGVYPILYALFDADQKLDHGAMRAQVEYCIAASAHGIAVLGNVTEYFKLTTAERIEVMEVVGEAIAGRVPYAVTIGEPSIAGQQEFVKAAERARASWVILQPPPVKGVPEREMVRFFGAVADSATLPVAIQNNPVNMDIWLTNESLVELHRNHPNVTLLKGEGAAAVVEAFIRATDGALDVFAGQGGIEYISNLESGCVGMIPAPDCLEAQVRVFELWKQGTEESRAEAVRIHKETLPLIVLMTRNLHSHQIPIGKHLLARRLGLGPVVARQPAAAASPFAVAMAERLSDAIFALDLGT